MVVFGLFLLLLMLIVGGLSVDVMRHETNRARMQATLDRAVLAAASLRQTGNDAATRAIVADYFKKAGIQGQLGAVVPVLSDSSRRVSATASARLGTLFMNMAGVPELTVPASAVALESVPDVEIVLVLDVSESMVRDQDTGNPVARLANLRTAATEFVDTVLAKNPDNRITVAIVPFNLGETLRAEYNVRDPHGVANSNCVDLPRDAYRNLTLSPTEPMPATAWADSIITVERTNTYRHYDVPYGTFRGEPIAHGTPDRRYRWCPATPGDVVRLPSHDATKLKEHINGLVGIGFTSINAGMRWGLTLLDPSTQPMFARFRGAGQVPAAFMQQPYEFNRPNTRKVIVLMTDGENFSEERVNEVVPHGFRSAFLPIWRANDGLYSIFHGGRLSNTNPTNVRCKPFWVPHLSTWHERPWTGNTTSMPPCYDPNLTYTGTTPQKWPEVWAQVRLHWVAWQLYARAGYTSTGPSSMSPTGIHDAQMNLFRTQTDIGAMDTQLLAVCDLARANNVIIYGIAFEAPENGRTAIRNCVSGSGRLASPNYFDAQGLQIATAFRSIAAQINALSLEQ